MDALLIGLIWLLVYAFIIAIIVYIIVRLATQFVPGFAPFAWIVWAIGGLILLVMMLRLFAPALGHAP